MRIVIIVPTYNEEKNIEILLPELINETLKLAFHEFEILIVDDESPDGTSAVVMKYGNIFNNVHLLSDKRKGYGKACLRGFYHAMNVLHASAVITMDADLSHPPCLICRFVACLEQGYDLVIGSRYIPQGATPDWSYKRRLLSRLGNMVAKHVGGIDNVNDCTSGFRAIGTEKLRKIEESRLNTKGYAFLTTLLYELLACNSKVIEIPLIFKDRKFGESKLRITDIIEFAYNILAIRSKSLRSRQC